MTLHATLRCRTAGGMKYDTQLHRQRRVGHFQPCQRQSSRVTCTRAPRGFENAGCVAVNIHCLGPYFIVLCKQTKDVCILGRCLLVKAYRDLTAPYWLSPNKSAREPYELSCTSPQLLLASRLSSSIATKAAETSQGYCGRACSCILFIPRNNDRNPSSGSAAVAAMRQQDDSVGNKNRT